MEKISKSRAIINNIFAVKLMGKICPVLLLGQGFYRVMSYTMWLFYSAFFMRQVINALTLGKPVGQILIFLAITVVVSAVASLLDGIYKGKIIPESNVKVNDGLYTILFKKVRNVELNCFEDSDFYDKYTLAMEKADARLIETTNGVFGVIFGFIACIFAFIFMYQVDPYSVLFIIFPILGNFVFNRKISHIDYERNKDMAPHNRRVAYINRVMYMVEYAKEIRLSRVYSLMDRQYKDAMEGVASVTKKYTKKGMILHWLYVNFTFSFIFEGMLQKWFVC